MRFDYINIDIFIGQSKIIVKIRSNKNEEIVCKIYEA